MYLFRSKVKCMKCQQNLRGKLERNKQVYICSMYSKKSTECIRYVVREKDLVDMVEGHLKLRGVEIEEELSKYVKVIEVTPNVGYKIYYHNDPTHSVLSTDNSMGHKYTL